MPFALAVAMTCACRFAGIKPQRTHDATVDHGTSRSRAAGRMPPNLALMILAA